MYYVMCASAPSLYIESTDSLIMHVAKMIASLPYHSKSRVTIATHTFGE